MEAACASTQLYFPPERFEEALEDLDLDEFETFGHLAGQCSEILQQVRNDLDDSELPLEDKEELRMKLFSILTVRSVALGLLREYDQGMGDLGAALRELEAFGEADLYSFFEPRLSGLMKAFQESLRQQTPPAGVLLTAVAALSFESMERPLSVALEKISEDFLVQGDYQSAIALAERLETLNMSLYESVLIGRRAAAMHLSGDSDAAVAMLKSKITEIEARKEPEDLGPIITPLCLILASLNRPVDCTQWAKRLVDETPDTFIDIAAEYVERERSPERLRNAIDLLEMKLVTLPRTGYQTYRVRIAIAANYLDLDELDTAERILRQVLPAFHARWIFPFPRPAPSQAYGDGLIALSTLITKRAARGETVRFMWLKSEFYLWVVVIGLLACLIIWSDAIPAARELLQLVFAGYYEPPPPNPRLK